MKVIVFFLTSICLVNAAQVTNQNLQNDFSDFLEIIPIEKIKKLIIKHLHDDPEFQAAVKYMKSPEWKDMIHELQEKPEVQEFEAFLKEAGVNLTELGSMFCGVLHNITVETDHKERSLKGFLDDVRQIIPLAKLIETFDKKMTTSPAFKELYDKISSEEAHRLLSKVRALPVFQKIVAEITAMGIDVERMLKVIYAVFGWSDVTTPQKV